MTQRCIASSFSGHDAQPEIFEGIGLTLRFSIHAGSLISTNKNLGILAVIIDQANSHGFNLARVDCL